MSFKILSACKPVAGRTDSLLTGITGRSMNPCSSNKGLSISKVIDASGDAIDDRVMALNNSEGVKFGRLSDISQGSVSAISSPGIVTLEELIGLVFGVWLFGKGVARHGMACVTIVCMLTVAVGIVEMLLVAEGIIGVVMISAGCNGTVTLEKLAVSAIQRLGIGVDT